MPKGAFDIYQTSDGYIAVTNATRRQILEALSVGERELPHLVELTGKAKPTLSSVHMKDLLAKRLIEAETHPTDSRRKVYRLIAQKIGSSDIPVDSLRDAVKEYVSISPTAARFPLAFMLESISAAPPGSDPAVLRAQAARFGTRASQAVQAQALGDYLMAVARLLEQEAIARPLRLDLENATIELAYGDGIAPDLDTEHVAYAIAGLIEGAGREKNLLAGRLEVEAVPDSRRCRLSWRDDATS